MSHSQVKLYDSPISANAHKVRMLLARLERPYERVVMNILEGETRTPGFAAKNRAQRVPVLELEDGTTIAESGAILAHLAEGTPYLPDDPIGRALVLRWMFFEQNHVEPTVAVVRYLTRWGDAAPEVLDWLRPRGVEALEVMESHLQSHAYFGAESESIADIALYGYTHVAAEGDFELALYPSLRAWHARVASHPLHLPLDGE